MWPHHLNHACAAHENIGELEREARLPATGHCCGDTRDPDAAKLMTDLSLWRRGILINGTQDTIA